MDKPVEELRILLLEDTPSDAALEESALRHAGLVFATRRVETRAEFERALDEFGPDIVLADYRLPAYNGREALEYTRRTHPHIPVIMVTGEMGDEAAVELLKVGARDYVLKDRLARLAPAIQRALSEEHGIRNRKLAEGKYKALFSEAMDGIVLIDCATWRIVDCNPEFERQTGRTIEQLRAVEVQELFPAEQREQVQQALLDVQRAGSGRGSSLKFQKPGGETVPFEFSSKFLSIQRQNFIQGVTRDISERVRAEQALRDSEARYRRITEGLTDYQYTVRVEDGHAVETTQSPACHKVTGYTSEEFATNPQLWIQMVVPEDRHLVVDQARQVMDGKEVPPFEHRIIRKDGELRWVRNTIILFKDASGNLVSYDGVIRDVTERVRADLALRESEEKFRSISSAAQDAILMMDNEGMLAYWNAAAEKIFGYRVDEALGQEMHMLLAPTRFHDDYRRGFARFRETGEGPVIGKTLELAALRKDGTEFPIELSLSAIKREGLWNAIGILRDISERKQIEQLVRDEKALSDSLIRALPGIFFLVDDRFRPLRWNDRMPELGGISPEALPAADLRTFIHEEDRQLATEKFAEALASGSAQMEARLTLTIGVRHYLLTGTRVETRRGYDVIVIGTDITELKQAEAALRHANRALKTLSDGNLALVAAANEDELLRRVADVIVHTGGHRLAAVHYAADDAERSLTPMAWSDMGETPYWANNLTWADNERGQLPVSKAVRSGEIQICHDIANDPSFSQWKDAALARGYIANLALPLLRGGKAFGCLSIYSSESAAFDEEELRLLEELANDLSYGIVTLRARGEREQQAALLRQSLAQSVQTIASTVEARDPYTAGHQQRVGDLATAIARELGLPNERVEGIHFAAIIHDLGKIRIPAEILSKPGKLNDLEFMLIKTHPQAGYDILKDVRFPWPIAETILQHHEKLDGSGYPRGLKGDQILLEARILTVADVVEAMSTHRPYRPALGNLSALSEIERGRGTVYDPAVVDACMRLFTEKGFRFRG